MCRILIPLLIGILIATGAAAQDRDRRAAYPNEPEGFVPWFEHDWQSFPQTHEGVSVVPASERGYFILSGVAAHVERATLIDDPEAPHGLGKSLRVRWPAGMRVGHGVFNYAIRSTPHRSHPERITTATPLQKWYISTWVYLEPADDGTWETHFDQFRHFSMNRHIGQTLAVWTFRGVLPYEGASVRWETGEPKRMEALRDYRLIGRRHEGASSTTLANTTPGMPLGEWVHMELLFDRTVKAPPLFATGDDGIGPVHVRYWANGELLLDRTIDNVYMELPFLELFFNLNQSGGISPSADKYIRLSGTYISGEVYAP